MTRIGSSKILFRANYNLWTIPASCGRPSPCHFPADATQLTSDGTQETQDSEPSWTSSTAPLIAPASAGGGGAGGGGSVIPAATGSRRGGRRRREGER